jgi:endonuclease/exonuclease/phosphatase family metal-dependent hydrolase
MRPIRAILAAAVAVLATLALAGDARAIGYRQTHLQFNVCGNACNGGGLAVVSDLVNAIERRGPHSVTLNEVCENQYDKLRSDLPAYMGQFDPTGATCHNGARYGNAILARATSLTLVGSWVLPNPAGDELRRLMCVSTDPPDGPPLIVCVTHISNESGNIAAQVSAVASFLSGLEVDGAMLVGGDFNADPADARMNPMYGACYGSGAGSFREADSDTCASRSTLNVTAGSDVLNEDTYARHKFDYVFLSDGHWSSAEADTTEVRLSDHDALWATATVRQ